MDDAIVGSVESIVFSSDETGFTVASLKEAKSGEMVSIVGTMPALMAGEQVVCTGSWKHHPRHGRQFDVEKYESKVPADLLGIEKYLGSGLISGIGPKYAERIVKKFGLKTMEIIDKYPGRLREVEGMGQKRVDKITQCWADQRSIRELMIFLQGHGIKPSVAQKVFKVHGEKSIEVIKENPFMLARTIFGIGFTSADEIATKLGIEKDAPVRIDAGIEYLLWNLSTEGHVCCPMQEVIDLATQTLAMSEEKIKDRLVALELDGKIVKANLENGPHLWVKPLYASEVGIAREMSRLLEAPCAIRPIDGEKGIAWIEEEMAIDLAKEQKVAIEEAMSDKVHIITGGPGTGKSTITKAILKMSEKLTGDILLAAPTGRAAKRMTEITRRKAATIHSLLEVDFQSGGFKKDGDSPLSCSLLIVDEASMIDTPLMYALLKAIPSKARLILIGDIDQLPSVGAGNVLKDMIDSDCVPVTRLTEIFRQARGSKIITTAHSINRGYMPSTENEETSDFFFIEKDDPVDIAQTILYLVEHRIPEKFRFHRTDDIQVLAPMKKGAIGIENLNHILQERLNPSDSPLQKYGRSFHLGDKVMQIRNNYDKKVYNGDIGRVVGIDRDDQTLSVVFDGKEITYSFLDLDELVLAYAVSIHKYQGSESPCVIIPVHTTHFKLLYRNLLYTGITRGRKLVILIGTKKALGIAIKNEEVQKRCTGLKELMMKNLTESPGTQLSSSP